MQPATVALNLATANPAQPAGSANQPAPGTPSFAQTLASKVDANNPPQQANTPQAKPQIPVPAQIVAVRFLSKTETKTSQVNAPAISQNPDPSSTHANVSASIASSALASSLPIPIPVSEMLPRSGESQPTPQDVSPNSNPVESLLSGSLPALQTVSACPSAPIPTNFVPNALADTADTHAALLQQPASTSRTDTSSNTDPAVPGNASATAGGTPEAVPTAQASDPSATPAPGIQTDSPKSGTPANIDLAEQSSTSAPARTTEPLTTEPVNAPDIVPEALPLPTVPLAANGLPSQASPLPPKDASDPNGGTQRVSPDTLPANAVFQVNAPAPASTATPKAAVPGETAASDKLQVPRGSESDAPPAGISRKDSTSTKSDARLPLPTEATAAPAAKLKEQGNVSENRHSDTQDAAPQKDTNSPPQNNSGESQQNSFEVKMTPDTKTDADSRTAAVSAVADSANANQTSVVANQGTTFANPLVSQHAAGQAAAREDNNSQVAPSDTQSTTLASSPSNPRLNDTHEIVNAQISGNASQSEIHLAMQVDRLGPVELHAHVSGEQMGASILVEKREAHAALAVELPALQQALSEKSLRVEHVWLTQSALHSTAGDAGNAAGQQSRQKAGTNLAASNSLATQPALAAAAPEQNEIFDERGHLSVRA